ncbi:MAG: hypothetical protein KDC62_01150 [Aequorivita sp.]|nr:hypothetical protein [Aequorivita sp.]
MKKQIFSLALWMFFGFVLIKAIDSILRFIINGYLYFGLWMEFPPNFLKYSIPVLSVIVYFFATISVLKYINKKANNFKLEELKFPEIEYIISLIIAIFLNPLWNKLMGLISEKLSAKLSYEISEFLNFYGVTQASIGICSWLSIIILSIYFYRIYKKSEIKIDQ